MVCNTSQLIDHSLQVAFKDIRLAQSSLLMQELEVFEHGKVSFVRCDEDAVEISIGRFDIGTRRDCYDKVS